MILIGLTVFALSFGALANDVRTLPLEKADVKAILAPKKAKKKAKKMDIEASSLSSQHELA
jgi:hypothetical protein